MSDVLMEVEVPVVSKETCQTAMADFMATIHPSATITDGMICAGGVEGQDACQVLYSHWLTGHHVTRFSPAIG